RPPRGGPGRRQRARRGGHHRRVYDRHRAPPTGDTATDHGDRLPVGARHRQFPARAPVRAARRVRRAVRRPRDQRRPWCRVRHDDRRGIRAGGRARPAGHARARHVPHRARRRYLRGTVPAAGALGARRVRAPRGGLERHRVRCRGPGGRRPPARRVPGTTGEIRPGRTQPEIRDGPARRPVPGHAGRDPAVRRGRPSVGMLAVARPYGAAASFLSRALDSIASGGGAVVAGVGLGLLGAGVIVGRTFAGLVSDRHGPGRLVWPGLGVAALGMAAIAALLVVEPNPWWCLLPTVVFGFGFGAVQNEALVGSFERMPRARLGTASASWNISFDAGTGLGSIVMGGLAAAGYVPLFSVAAIVVLAVGGPAAVWARRT